MEMERISEATYRMLMRQGLSAGSAATGRADLRKRAGTEAPAKSNREEVVKLNRSGEKPSGIAYVVHTNHAVPTSTRKRTARVPFLVLVK